MFNEKKKIRNAFTKYCGDNSSWEISDDGEHSYISISDKVNYPRPKGRELRVFASTEPLVLTQQNWMA